MLPRSEWMLIPFLASTKSIVGPGEYQICLCVCFCEFSFTVPWGFFRRVRYVFFSCLVEFAVMEDRDRDGMRER